MKKLVFIGLVLLLTGCTKTTITSECKSGAVVNTWYEENYIINQPKDTSNAKVRLTWISSDKDNNVIKCEEYLK